MPNHFLRLANLGLDLLFPRICLGCGTEGAWLCPACGKRLPALATLTCLVCGRRRPDGRTCANCRKRFRCAGLVASFPYADPLGRELIHELKYHSVRELAGTLAERLAETIRQLTPWLTTESALVPVPLHKSRERERGFNQAELIATALGERLGVPTVNALRRTRATRSQIELNDPDLRRENVAGAFALARLKECPGRCFGLASLAAARDKLGRQFARSANPRVARGDPSDAIETRPIPFGAKQLAPHPSRIVAISSDVFT